MSRLPARDLLPAREPALPAAQSLVADLRRALFFDSRDFRRRVRGCVTLCLPRNVSVSDDLVEAFTSVCVMTVLDGHDADEAARVVQRELAANEGEAMEAICDWTVRRELRRLRRLQRGRPAGGEA